MSRAGERALSPSRPTLGRARVSSVRPAPAIARHPVRNGDAIARRDHVCPRWASSTLSLLTPARGRVRSSASVTSSTTLAAARRCPERGSARRAPHLRREPRRALDPFRGSPARGRSGGVGRRGRTSRVPPDRVAPRDRPRPCARIPLRLGERPAPRDGVISIRAGLRPDRGPTMTEETMGPASGRKDEP